MIRDYETGLTPKELRRRFRYVKSTGLLLRRVPILGRWGQVQDPIGSVAGSLHHDGYLYTGINGRLYLVHRLIWTIVEGRWPRKEVDHHDGVRNNNRWKNLRHANSTQNRQNSLGQRSRVGKFPGVYAHSRSTGKFVAQIKHKGRVIYLGWRDSAEEAYKLRVAAEKKYFGRFAGSARP